MECGRQQAGRISSRAGGLKFTDMSTLSYTITATQAEFNNFADRLGYMPEITTLGVASPNPETRTQYITRLMKESQDSLFFGPFVTEIDQQIRDAREAEKAAMKANIRNRSTITFVA